MDSDAVLDERPDLLEDLGGTGVSAGLLMGVERHSQKCHTGGTVSDFGILCARNVDKRARSGVHNVEELEQGGAVVYICQQNESKAREIKI